VKLTDVGLQKIDEILEAIYSYLLMIKESSPEDHENFYRFLQNQSIQNFKFHTENDALSNVKISSHMINYENEDIIRGSKLFLQYDQSVILQFINYLNSEKFNITVITNKHEEFPFEEDVFSTKYDEVNVPEKIKMLWQERKLNPQFFLKKSNPYQANDFTIFKDSLNLKYPVTVYESETIRTWHKLDSIFNSPKVYFAFAITSPIYRKDIKIFLSMKIFEKILHQNLKKKFSLQQDAGIYLAGFCRKKNFCLSIGGFNDKLMLVLDEFLKELKAIIFNFSENDYQFVLDDYKKQIRQTILQNETIAYDESHGILSTDHFTNLHMFKALETVNFDMCRKNVIDFISKVFIQILAQGNITQEKAIEINEIVQKYFQFSEIGSAQLKQQKCYQLPIGTNTIRMKSFRPNDNGSIILNIYQIGPYNLRKNNMANLIASFLSSKAFEFLRTKHQLGYAVSFYLLKIENVLHFGLKVLSQENKNSFTKVFELMKYFIKNESFKHIHEMTHEQFENIKNARVKSLRAPNLSLTSEFETNFDEIENETFLFNRKEEAAFDCESLILEDIQRFYDLIFDERKVRILSIQVKYSAIKIETFLFFRFSFTVID
jgi:nardilysin